MADWEREQRRLDRAIADRERFRPPIAGRFRDEAGRMRMPDHPWLRVLEAGHDRKTDRRYYLVQMCGSGASWWPESSGTKSVSRRASSLSRVEMARVQDAAGSLSP